LKIRDDTVNTRPEAIDDRPLDAARASASAHLGTLAHGCPDLFPLELDRTGLSPRDAVFANVIVEFSARRWLTLRWLIEQHLNRPFTQLQPELCGVLLAGAAQLVFLDGVPAYAAIDESVEYAKRTIRPGAGRLTNAVLRRIAELVGETPERAPTWSMARNEIPLADGSAMVLRKPIMPEEERMRFCVATSCPSALYESMLERFPEDRVRHFARHNMAPAPTVLNVEHALTSVDIPDLDPHEKPGFAVYRGNHRELTDLLDSGDDIWAQDVASAEAAHVAARCRPEPGIILDLCAGLGTKTRQLAAVFPNSTIVATDTNDARRSTLRRVFQSHERVDVIDPNETHRWRGKADLILLDVPCSNTGVLARRVEARYRATDRKIAALVTVQRQIIVSALPLLAPDGALVYSTCSIDGRENEEQAAWAAQQHRMRIAEQQHVYPSGGPGEPATRYSDGSFAAAIVPM